MINGPYTGAVIRIDPIGTCYVGATRPASKRPARVTHGPSSTPRAAR
jgi:hypothetical protein